MSTDIHQEQLDKALALYKLERKPNETIKHTRVYSKDGANYFECPYIPFYLREPPAMDGAILNSFKPLAEMLIIVSIDG